MRYTVCMLLLALDTASHLCSAALYDTAHGVIVGRCTDDIGRGHAERMMGVVDAALAEAGAGLADVGRIGVTIGPGSFTGIRVGVATARGLALALGVAAVGVTTLEAIAAAVPAEKAGNRPVLALIDARRGEIYGQLFASLAEPLSPPRALTPAGAAYVAVLHRAVLTGSGAPIVAALVGGGGMADILGTAAAPDIADVARIAAARQPAASPAPLYLRSPDAKPQAGFALARQAPAPA